MPNIVFAPRPMVDPYAGKVGEILRDLFQTIGQIKELRTQRNQTNAVLDVMKTPLISDEQKAMGMQGMTEEDKRVKILNIAQYGGGVMGNMLARQSLAGMLMSPEDKALKEARRKLIESQAAYYKGGGASGKVDPMKQFRDLKTKRDYLATQYENEIEDEDRRAKLKSQVENLDKQMDALMPKSAPAAVNVDAVTMAAPVTGLPPQSQQPSPTMGNMALQAEQFLEPTGESVQTQQPSPARTKTPSNLQFKSGGSFGGGYVPVSTPQPVPQQAKADVTIAQGTEIPKVSSDEDYDKLPSGAEFIDAETGKKYRKP